MPYSTKQVSATGAALLQACSRRNERELVLVSIIKLVDLVCVVDRDCGIRSHYICRKVLDGVYVGRS